MNRLHRWYCRSRLWRRHLHGDVLPAVLDGVTLAGSGLEVGPGPGLATDVLRPRMSELTVLENDPYLAEALRTRLAETKVAVVEGDGTNMPFPARAFDVVACFTMLHHLPTVQAQDRLLGEALRVLRPGGWLVGSDSLSTPVFRLAHWRDTMVPVDPDTFAERLSALGFADIEVVRRPGFFGFHARLAV